MRKLATSIAAVLSPTVAAAHPHHAEQGLDLGHYLSDPSHLAMGVLAVGVAALVVLTLQARRKPSAFTQRRR